MRVLDDDIKNLVLQVGSRDGPTGVAYVAVAIWRVDMTPRFSGILTQSHSSRVFNGQCA
jgi:hypothetical protein